MITWKKIKIAINSILAKNFNNIKIMSKDVSEGFEKPSFFVEFDDARQEGLFSQIKKSVNVRIYYFPNSEEASVEIIDVMERLGKVFDLKLQVEDRFLNISETRFNESDNVLQFEFDIIFEDARKAEFNELIFYFDKDGNPIKDENGNFVRNEEDIPDEIDEYHPEQVIVDEHRNPVLNRDGNPIPIKMMENLDIEKE